MTALAIDFGYSAGEVEQLYPFDRSCVVALKGCCVRLENSKPARELAMLTMLRRPTSSAIPSTLLFRAVSRWLTSEGCRLAERREKLATPVWS